MDPYGIVWAGVRTDNFAGTTDFFRHVMGLHLHELRHDFAWFTLPDSSQLEIFGPQDPDHRHFTTGPVPSFHVHDVHGFVAKLRAAGVDTYGPWGTPSQGWAHFRAPDGNVYGLSAGEEYRR